jgi:hypothetical protein
MKVEKKPHILGYVLELIISYDSSALGFSWDG